mmetsp:Transcript_19573/g.42291  ORF Transcript_19573/g.42291 Transcript_19573/m.42291 type:complete len:201 (-) Transcript_19573:18-620(-)
MPLQWVRGRTEAPPLPSQSRLLSLDLQLRRHIHHCHRPPWPDFLTPSPSMRWRRWRRPRRQQQWRSPQHSPDVSASLRQLPLRQQQWQRPRLPWLRHLWRRRALLDLDLHFHRAIGAAGAGCESPHSWLVAWGQTKSRMSRCSSRLLPQPRRYHRPSRFGRSRIPRQWLLRKHCRCLPCPHCCPALAAVGGQHARQPTQL